MADVWKIELEYTILVRANSNDQALRHAENELREKLHGGVISAPIELTGKSVRKLPTDA